MSAGGFIQVLWLRTSDAGHVRLGAILSQASQAWRLTLPRAVSMPSKTSCSGLLLPTSPDPAAM